MGTTSLYQLLASELEAVDDVIIAAYGLTQGRKRTLQRYLALQPDGAFVAKQDDVIVGFGAAIQYTAFAYIDLMAVHPTAQKQGIGHLLVEHILGWLDTSKCSTVLLDATPIGAPLYEHFGFVEDDTTLVLRYNGDQGNYACQVAGERDNVTLHDCTSVLNREQFPTLFAYDACAFGSERATVLASYWADDPQRVMVTSDVEGQITGYLIAQSGILGPWVANTIEDAERLLTHALTLPFKQRPGVFVSVRNESALNLLQRYGFSEQRTLKHMRRGKEVQRSRATTLYGQASLGLG
ncbi:MAG: GNAT family N-acetyltransferase [Ktedonobacteraceae bacterium]|nr:GNAT family N-acetyltransferase [Ktedonobacteraceae bacterium]